MTLQQFFIANNLTPREIEVATEVAQGKSNRVIADQLSVTEKAVKWHVTHIFKKVGVASRAQLIVACIPYINGKEKTARLPRSVEA